MKQRKWPMTHIQSELKKVSNGTKTRNRYNKVPHLTHATNGKVTNSQLDTTKECQEVSPFPAGDHKAHINRSTQRHSKHKTEKNIKDPSTALERSVKYFTGGLNTFTAKRDCSRIYRSAKRDYSRNLKAQLIVVYF